MPSCSSKLSVLLKNESSDLIENIVLDNKVVLRHSVGATLRFFCTFCGSIEALPLYKINVLSHQSQHFGKLCQVPKYYVADIRKLEKLKILLLTFKCEIQKIESIFQETYILVVLQLFSQNVICLFIVYFWLRLLLYSNLIKPIDWSRSFNFIQFYGNIYDIVMAVDETNLHVNNLPNGDKLSSSSEIEKPEEVHSSVINENQITIKSEYQQIENGVLHENSIDVKIKEEVNENCETITNGDIINNCCTNSIKSVDLNDVSQTAKELSDVLPNNKPNDRDKSVEKLIENSAPSAPKEEQSEELNNKPQVESIKQVSSTGPTLNDSKLNKEKPKDKENCVNNHVSSSSSSSSSSSKKYDSHVRSHQSSSSSSSSSRHKYKDSREDRHKSSSSSSSRVNDVSSSSRRDDGKQKSESRSKSRSCHHKPEDKCHCKSHHRSHHHSEKSKKYQSVKTQCTPDEITFELNQNKFDPSNPFFTRVPWVPHPQLTDLKYGRFIRIEVDRNGGASVCHLYMDEISHLTEAQMKECASEFIKLSYSEDENECAYHVMGIVHGAASYLPDLVDYMADHYPTLIVKTGSLASRDNHTTTMAQYRDEVYKTYSNGTFRYAPLDQLSICGVLGEEVGAYFPDFVARLEQSPFMKPVMPWSSLSVVETDNPRESNDGPIFWVRPGEQMLPANEALKESARPKKRRNNELDNLAYIGGSRFSEARESLFQDRTKAHADQVGVDYGISNTAPTAAVGVLKAVNCGHPEHGNRATKDVVAFHAQDYNELLEILMLDLYEPPQTQCTKWIEVSKLNTLRREGIRFAHLQLHDNDVYYLPRKIIHQFQTISSVASVAWHIRYRDYFSILGAPNLHTPTGINKGQVFYEKKNVAVYCPPVCENDFLAAVTNGESGLKTPKKIDRLKEYSPFKHSPRKMHKYQSKKQSSLPPQSSSAVKKETGTLSSEQEKKSSSSSKKRERSKSNDRVSPTNRTSKDESRKSSESSHNRRSSGDHTPSSKEHKSQERHSSHRKEVKNLDSEFSSSGDKSSREKSPKSKHSSRKSSDSKHSSGSSKQRRHEDSSKRSKRDSGRDQNENSSQKTEEKKGGTELKRKHDESSNHSPAKKIKEECSDVVAVESSKKNSECEPELSVEQENQSLGNSNCEIINQDVDTSCKKSVEMDDQENNCKVVNDVSDATEDDVNASQKIPNPAPETNSQNTNNQIMDFDLKQHASYAAFMGQVPPFSLPPPPPPPPNSPPVNPPPPPSPPVKSPAKNSDSPDKNQQPNSFQDNCISSKEKSDTPVKKVKKKIKKTSESYDLLGDIMSKMDKKK